MDLVVLGHVDLGLTPLPWLGDLYCYLGLAPLPWHDGLCIYLGLAPLPWLVSFYYEHLGQFEFFSLGF